VNPCSQIAAPEHSPLNLYPYSNIKDLDILSQEFQVANFACQLDNCRIALKKDISGAVYHARLSFQNFYRRPQHGRRPLIMARYRNER
jgi:hypothetical protein